MDCKTILWDSALSPSAHTHLLESDVMSSFWITKNEKKVSPCYVHMILTSLRNLLRGAFKIFFSYEKETFIFRCIYLSYMETHLIKIQTALFFEKPVPRPDLFILPINEKLKDIFDVMPTILPLPEGAPLEIPIVQLTSTKNNFQTHISRIRADFFFNADPQRRIKDLKDIEKDIILKLNNFVEAISSKIEDNHFVRIGIVAQYFIDDEKSTETILNTYMKKELENVQEVTLRFNQKNKICNLNVNDIAKLETIKGRIGGKDRKGFIIERDINNIPKKGVYLPKKTLKDFIKSTLGLYSKPKVEELI